jgi:pimeloyl-ACP methyl ester carboxylesterase
MLRVPSSDGVTVAVHELAGTAGADHPVVLIAHATGFHGHAYLPVAAAMAPRFHTFAFDFRGHGDTPLAPGWVVGWDGYGDDALGAAEAVAATPRAPGGLIGFGHSMGGTALLLAAHRRPALFSVLVLFEPIVPPIDLVTAAAEGNRVNSLVVATRRRRALFPSIDAARANYAAKPPLDAFEPAALDAYVRHGFHADVDGAGVRLKCDPELEARTFEAGTKQRTWELLPEIDVPVVVASGRVGDDQPSRFAADVADALPHGRFVELTELDHFGPMTHSHLIGALIARWSDEYAR